MDINKILKKVETERAARKHELTELDKVEFATDEERDLARVKLQAAALGYAVAEWNISAAIRNNTSREVLSRYLREGMGDVVREPDSNRSRWTHDQWQDIREAAREPMRFVSGLLEINLFNHDL